MPTDLPPILILMCDQQRGDALSCAGTPALRTPNMDRIAREGVRFCNAVSVSPVCTPARASFVSGLYPHNHGMWANRGRLPAEDETFFHHLQRRGYYVAYVGKSHFYPHGGGHMRDRELYMHRRGINHVHETTGPWASCTTRSYMTDHWESKGLWDLFKEDYARRREAGPVNSTWPSPLPEQEHLDSYIGRQAVEFVEGYDRHKPLCLFVGFGGPHEPWDPPGRFAQMYDPSECPASVPPRPEPAPEGVSEQALKALQRGRVGPVSEQQARKIRALYYGKVSLIDEWFGRILDAFQARGWLEDALVVHWSDHGEMLCEHGAVHKSVFFDGALKIVMNLRWPGRIEPGKVSDALVETVDAFPTILETVQAEHSGRCLGRSLWPCLRDPEQQVRDAAFSQVLNTSMVITQEHKYACDQAGRGYMLFDRRNDPNESQNLVGRREMQELEGQMRERLLRFYLSAQVKQ